MRFSADALANAVAWAVIVLLIGAALLVANRLGFVGLLLLGGAASLVCTLAELDQEAPTWGTHVFRARMEARRSPEEHAALQEERRAFLSPLRFGRGCGVAIAGAGLAGVLWQGWAP